MRDCLELAKKLICIESASGNEQKSLEFVKKLLAENKAEVWQNDNSTAGLFRAKNKTTKKAVLLADTLILLSRAKLKIGQICLCAQLRKMASFLGSARAT